MHVAQLAVSSLMSLSMPGQNKLSFAFRRHYSIPMCPWCIICNICELSLLGITRWYLLRTRPLSTLRSSLKFQNSLTVISGRLPAGNVLIFQQTGVAAGNRKVRVM